MRRTVAGLVVVLAFGSDAGAQDTHLDMFLYEKSYAALGTPSVIGSPDYYSDIAEPPLLAEAQFAVHLAMRRGFLPSELREGRKGTGLNIYITPQFRLRARDVHSGPVASISFMPKFTFQWLRSTGGGSNPRTGSRRIFAAKAVIGHHSNGGATCEFLDEDPMDPIEACRFPNASFPDDLPAEDRQYWVEGGNFSTNYVELGVSARFGTLDEIKTDESHWRWALDVGLTLQRNHSVGFPLPGGAQPDFARIYGVNRARLELAGHVNEFLINGVALRGWMKLDAFNARRQFAGGRDYTLASELMVHGLREKHRRSDPPVLLRWLPSFLGVGLRYSRGQDYYNTQFVRDISFLQLIFAVDPWSPSAEEGR